VAEKLYFTKLLFALKEQEAQLMLTTRSTRLAVSPAVRSVTLNLANFSEVAK